MFDLVLKGGIVIDGTRSKPYAADVCIKDGKIAGIVEKFSGESKEVVDISGKVVSPGFIDIHSHSDACPLVDYEPESKLYQGVTSEITGNCGISILPSTPETNDSIADYVYNQLELPVGDLSIKGMHTTKDYAERVNAKGTNINYGVLVGHGTLRGAVMGFVDRDPTDEEMEQLKATLDRELENGAFGMSLGLIYPPSAFCKSDELVELAKVIKKHDAILSVHMRNEGPRLFQAVDEMIDITRRSGVHLQISHLKLMGKPQWGRSQELLDKIETARQEGMNITCDQYPFTATSTSMTALMPHWAHDGGLTALYERVKNPSEELKAAANQEMENRGGPAAVMISSTHHHHPEWEGKTVADLAAEWNIAPVDVVMKVLAECETAVACIYFSINEDDMCRIMQDMRIAIGSDGYGFSYDRSITSTNPHPRSFATFPGFLRIARERKLLSLEDAVYKITGLPADILGIKDRGVLKVGNIADITVFDGENVRDTSTFLDSVKKPEGIDHVIVAGGFAIKNGEATGLNNGKVLLKK